MYTLSANNWNGWSYERNVPSIVARGQRKDKSKNWANLRARLETSTIAV